MIARVKTTREVELDLIAATKGGDKQAMQELCEMHKGFVWQVARSVERSWKHLLPDLGMEVEDLVQIGFIRLLRCVELFDASREFRLLTYSGLSMHREITRELQKAQRLLRCLASDNSDGISFVAASVNVVEDAARNEEVSTVRRAVAFLPSREREILSRRMDGETLGVIGDSLSITKERVRQIENSAKTRLRDLVGA